MSKGRLTTKSAINTEEEGNEQSSFDIRRGPWTLEEDNLLIHYIACNGEGRWNSLAKCAGLKRTGKSCRLRWLNYLKPDIKRGNLTPQEQLLILELHSKWGNRWSKIAQHLPGRTDNEIKNYWRTRVQKQARQLNVDSNGKKFLETIRQFWMPRLREKVEQTASFSSSSSSSISSISTLDNHDPIVPSLLTNLAPLAPPSSSLSSKSTKKIENWNKCSSDSARTMQMEPALIEGNPNSPLQTHVTNSAFNSTWNNEDCYHADMTRYDAEIFRQPEISGMKSFSECQISEADNWFNDDTPGGSFWNMDEIWHSEYQWAFRS